MADPLCHCGFSVQKRSGQVTGCQSELVFPAHEWGHEDLGRGLRHLRQLAVQAEVAHKAGKRRQQALLLQSGQPDQFLTFWAVVQKTVRSVFSQPAVLTKGLDRAAGMGALLQDEQARFRLFFFDEVCQRQPAQARAHNADLCLQHDETRAKGK